MKFLVSFLILMFVCLSSLKAQFGVKANNNYSGQWHNKEKAGKEMKTARLFIISGYVLTGLGGLLWTAESALNQGEGNPATTPYIIMTTVGVGSLILGYTLKGKARRKNSTSLSIAPQQTDVARIVKGSSIIPSLKLKIHL